MDLHDFSSETLAVSQSTELNHLRQNVWLLPPLTHFPQLFVLEVHCLLVIDSLINLPRVCEGAGVQQ